MIEVVEYSSGKANEAIRRILNRTEGLEGDILVRADAIVRDVRLRGDAALIDYTSRFDAV